MAQFLIAIDQLLNTLIGGYADETMSSHSYRMWRDRKPWGVLKYVIDALFFWQPYHCFKSYVSEIRRAQMPPEFRTNIPAR